MCSSWKRWRKRWSRRSRHPWPAPQWRMPPGQNSSNWVPEHDSFTAKQRGSRPDIGNLPEIWDVNPMNMENYRGVILALTTHLPFLFQLIRGGCRENHGDGPGWPRP